MIEALKCGNCGALDAGPREICPHCHEAALQAHEVAGDGALVTWTVIRRPPAAFRSEGCYAVAVIKLDAGVIKSITGYREEEQRLPSTYTGESFLTLFDSTRNTERFTFQQELRFASTGSW